MHSKNRWPQTITSGQSTTNSSLVDKEQGRQNDDSSRLSCFELGIQDLIQFRSIDAPRDIHTRLDLAKVNAQMLDEDFAVRSMAE
jgi:hypothetical protein